MYNIFIFRESGASSSNQRECLGNGDAAEANAETHEQTNQPKEQDPTQPAVLNKEAVLEEFA